MGDLPRRPPRTMGGARDILAATPKPVMIAALLEPGWIATWCLAEMSSAVVRPAGGGRPLGMEP